MEDAPDAGMDFVQKRLMFEDDSCCILVDENDRVVGHESKYNLTISNQGYISSCVDRSHPLYRDSELIEENALGARNATQRKLLDELVIPAEEVPVNPNPEEVADVKYVAREELSKLLRKADAGEGGLKLSLWFQLVVDSFLFEWWDHVEKGTLKEASDMKTIHRLI